MEDQEIPERYYDVETEMRRRVMNVAKGFNPAEQYTDEEIAKIVHKWTGGLYLAASELGCTKEQLRLRIYASPVLRDFLSEYDELIADYAEFNVRTGVIRGDRDYTKYYLDKKAKSRNYTARTEVSGSNGDPLQVEHKHTVDLSNLSTEALREIARLANKKPESEILEVEYKVVK